MNSYSAELLRLNFFSYLHHFRIVKCKDPFKYNDIGTIHGFTIALSSMSDEIVNRNFDLLSFPQSLYSFNQQGKIESIRMVKIIFVLPSQVMLFLIQNLYRYRKLLEVGVIGFYFEFKNEIFM